MKGSLHIALFALIIFPCSSGSSPISSRPDPEDAPTFARWMVGQGSWGVLTTLDKSDQPFGNVVSYTDAGVGIPYFYLSTTLDPTGGNAVQNSRSSFTLSESVLGYCNATTDPQSPICAKITLSGNLKLLAKNSKEAALAEATLFANHPQLAGYPKKNGFRVFKLMIGKIFLVNKYAPPRNLTAYDYLHLNI
ncbi:hypothetical protein C2S52_006446 [Perilla frutescens var. hirtella]|nr:hypothetical protein C2S51_009358 [Perilla frutescens var. frutescens]KAH6786894.1 hypothetical protein C2S52_006446 [Perilla frutescens var. hirtella]